MLKRAALIFVQKSPPLHIQFRSIQILQGGVYYEKLVPPPPPTSQEPQLQRQLSSSDKKLENRLLYGLQLLVEGGIKENMKHLLREFKSTAEDKCLFYDPKKNQKIIDFSIFAGKKGSHDVNAGKNDLVPGTADFSWSKIESMNGTDLCEKVHYWDKMGHEFSREEIEAVLYYYKNNISSEQLLRCFLIFRRVSLEKRGEILTRFAYLCAIHPAFISMRAGDLFQSVTRDDPDHINSSNVHAKMVCSLIQLRCLDGYQKDEDIFYRSFSRMAFCLADMEIRALLQYIDKNGYKMYPSYFVYLLRVLYRRKKYPDLRRTFLQIQAEGLESPAAYEWVMRALGDLGDFSSVIRFSQEYMEKFAKFDSAPDNDHQLANEEPYDIQSISSSANAANEDNVEEDKFSDIGASRFFYIGPLSAKIICAGRIDLFKELFNLTLKYKVPLDEKTVDYIVTAFLMLEFGEDKIEETVIAELDLPSYKDVVTAVTPASKSLLTPSPLPSNASDYSGFTHSPSKSSATLVTGASKRPFNGNYNLGCFLQTLLMQGNPAVCGFYLRMSSILIIRMRFDLARKFFDLYRKSLVIFGLEKPLTEYRIYEALSSVYLRQYVSGLDISDDVRYFLLHRQEEKSKQADPFLDSYYLKREDLMLVPPIAVQLFDRIIDNPTRYNDRISLILNQLLTYLIRMAETSDTSKLNKILIDLESIIDRNRLNEHLKDFVLNNIMELASHLKHYRLMMKVYEIMQRLMIRIKNPRIAFAFETGQRDILDRANRQTDFTLDSKPRNDNDNGDDLDLPKTSMPNTSNCNGDDPFSGIKDIEIN